MNSFPKPIKITQRTLSIVDPYTEKINNLMREKSQSPSMVLTLMSNLYVNDITIPGSILYLIDFSKNPDMPTDSLILGELVKLVSNGVIQIEKVRYKNIGEFELVFNFIRGFRPKRFAKKVNLPLNIEFNKKGFHYGYPECDPEKFTSIQCGNDVSVDFLFNRYPFIPYHFLWIPDRKEGHNQFLDTTNEYDNEIIKEALSYVMESTENSIRLCYNSMGAHASVNSLHFQGFILTEKLIPPFERLIQKHINNGNKSGDVNCYFKGTKWFNSSDSFTGLTDFIAMQNKVNKPYNLYITPFGVACFPRKPQDDERYFELIENASFTTGFAFMELLGCIICPNFNVSIFEILESKIKQIYDALTID